MVYLQRRRLVDSREADTAGKLREVHRPAPGRCRGGHRRRRGCERFGCPKLFCFLNCVPAWHPAWCGWCWRGRVPTCSGPVSPFPSHVKFRRVSLAMGWTPLWYNLHKMSGPAHPADAVVAAASRCTAIQRTHLVCRPTFGKSHSWCRRLPAGLPGPQKKSQLGFYATSVLSFRASGKTFA